MTRDERNASILFFAAAIILYAPALWWGLPEANAADRIHPWGTDELAPMGFGELYAAILHASRRFDPRYPLLHYIVEAVAAAPYLLALRLTGGLQEVSAVYPYGLTDPVGALKVLTILGRIPSLLMSAGTVVVAWRTGLTLWGRSAGIVAGTATMLMYPMFYYSRTSNVDAPALFWASLAILVFAAILRDGLTRNRAMWLGIWAALATATKDQNYALFAGLLPALFAVPVLTREAGSNRLRVLLPGALAGALVYLFASGLAFHPERFLLHVQFIRYGSPVSALRQAYSATPATLAGYLAVLRTTTGYVLDAMGPAGLAAALLGLALCVYRRDRAWVLILGAAGMVAGVIVPVRFVEFRFVLPIGYLLMLLAGSAFAAPGGSRTHETGPALSRWIRPARAALFAATVGWLLVRGADLTWQMLHDSRYEAARWLREHARPGDQVTHSDHAYKLPRLERGVISVMLPIGAESERYLRDEQPRFVTVIPVLRGETVHEHFLPDGVYRQLVDGSLGYRRAAVFRSDALFLPDPITYVNPTVTIFERVNGAAPSP